MIKYVKKILIIILLIVMISSVLFGKTFNKSFAATDELLQKQQAIVEIAKTYLAQGENIQYNQTWRQIGSSPEKATTEDPVFLDCSSFVYSVYKQALNISLPASNTAGMMNVSKNNQSDKNYIPIYIETATNPDISGLNEKNLQPGDLIVYRKESSGHVMLYIGDGMIIHSTGSDSNWENNGSIRKMRLTELTEEGSSRYLLSKNSDGTYNKKQISVMRILSKYAGTLTPATSTRLEMPGVLIEKISNPANKHTVQLGQEIEYKIKITNNSSVIYNQFKVTDTITNFATYIQDSANYSGTTDGASIVWNIQTLVPNQTLILSYKVKVGTDTSYIGKEIKTSAKVGNIESNIISNIIGYGLSNEEKESLIETANKYLANKEYVQYVLASGCTEDDIKKLPENATLDNSISLSVMGLIKAVYYNSLGIDLNFVTTEQVVNDIFEKYAVGDYTYKLKEKNDTNIIRKMVVADFCGAKNSWGGNGLLDEHVPFLYEKNLEIGDVLLYRYNMTTSDGVTSEYGSVCMYLGPQKIIRLTGDGVVLEEGEVVTKRIEAIFKYQKFAILRPALVYDAKSLSAESVQRKGNLLREQKEALEYNVEDLMSNSTNIKSETEFAKQIYSQAFNVDISTITSKTDTINEKYLQIGDIFINGDKINLYVGNNKLIDYSSGSLINILLSDYKNNVSSYKIVRPNNHITLNITDKSKQLITRKISDIGKNTKTTEYGNEINRIANRYYNNSITYSISERELDVLPENTLKIDSAGLAHNIYKQAFEIDLPSTATEYLSDENKKYRVSDINVSNIGGVAEANFEKGDIIVYKYKSGTSEGKVTFMYIGNNQQIRVSSANGVNISSFSSMISSIQEHKNNGNLLDVAVIRPNQIYSMNKDESLLEYNIQPGEDNLWNSEKLKKETTSGINIKYNITVENKSNVNMLDVPVEIQVPEQLVTNIVSNSPYYIKKEGNKVTWNIGTLSAKDKVTIDYEIHINSTNDIRDFKITNIPNIHGIGKLPYIQNVKIGNVDSDKYSIEGRYIKKVESNTKIAQLNEGLITKYNTQIIDSGTTIEDNNSLVKTGMILKANNLEYTIIVDGDIDKNGKVTLNDLALLRKTVLKTKVLSEIEEIAADMDYNNKVTLNDLAKMRKYILNK